MKDALGHGSDPRGAHSEGVSGLPPTLRANIWYHGSPTGEPGAGAVHVGTERAARIALEARVGIPADGYGWHGQEYGKTLLAGQDTLRRMGQISNTFGATGYNARAPKNDYYAPDRDRADNNRDRAKFGGGATVPYDARPNVRAYQIVGKMGNSPDHYLSDSKANASSKTIKNHGIYYKNEAEDSGQISAVVPGKNFLRKVI